MKHLIAVGILLWTSLSLKAQQDPFLSQHMFQVPYYNPAAVGASERIGLAAGYRMQLIGLPNAPLTFTFTSDIPFNLFGQKHGIGLNMYSDQLGFQHDLALNLNYAFRFQLGPGSLALGFRAGMIRHELSPEWEGGGGVTSITNDPAIPLGGKGLVPDLGLGAYYHGERMYLGLSVNHLNEPVFQYEVLDPAQPISTEFHRNWYLMGGYAFPLPNTDFELIPSFLFHTVSGIYHISLNTNLRYKEKYWTGVSYFMDGPITVLLGAELLDHLTLGFSYSILLSPMMAHSTGSLELFASYYFGKKRPKNRL